jgi:hypothetical protein
VKDLGGEGRVGELLGVDERGLQGFVGGLSVAGLAGDHGEGEGDAGGESCVGDARREVLCGE